MLFWKWHARFERGTWVFPTTWHRDQFITEKRECDYETAIRRFRAVTRMHARLCNRPETWRTCPPDGRADLNNPGAFVMNRVDSAKTRRYLFADYNADALTNLDRFVLFALAASIILITLAGVCQ